jgi:hypothetical protein
MSIKQATQIYTGGAATGSDVTRVRDITPDQWNAAMVDENGVAFTVTADELNALAAAGLSAGEVGVLNGVTAGTVTASKAAVVDANKDIGSFRNVVAVNFDAGASAVAGTVDVFPTTAAKGKVSISKTDNDTDSTTSIVVGAQAAARTYTVPDALGNTQFLLGVQGTTARTATADGLTTGTIADAGREQFIVVTSASADHIIVLPTPTPGTRVALLNGATGYEIRSSAPGTVAINGGAEADAESAIAANVYVELVCVSATAWIGRQYSTAGTQTAVQVAAAA